MYLKNKPSLNFNPQPKTGKKVKVCKGESTCKNPLFSHGYCKYHWNQKQGRKNIFANNKLAAKIKTPKESIAKLKKELDEVHHEYIRLRDYGKPCICCGKYATPTDALQAGHYHSCRYLSIRWDDQNVNGQLMSCNVFNQGNFYGYTGGLIKKYGKGVIQLLTIKKNNYWKPTAFELRLLINHYKEQIQTLKNKTK